MFESTIVLIPAKNESASIEQVIRKTIEFTGADVLVIDDASNDHTAKISQNAGAVVLPLCTGLGAWGAVQAGIRYAILEGYQFAITMDADGQHKAQDLHALIRPIHEGRANVAIGACTDRGSRMRKIAWAYLKQISGLTPQDITSGFRAYDRSTMTLLASAEATLLEYQDIGVLALITEHSFSIEEVKVSMIARSTGHSRVYSSWLMVAYYMLHSSILALSKR